MNGEMDSWEDLISLYQAVVDAKISPVERPCREDFTLRPDGVTSRHGYKRHLSWMLHHMPDLVTDTLKFQRWLGFVQCLLAILGYFTINQMRDQTRNITTGSEAQS